MGLRWQTPPAWIDAVMGDLTAFLQDHAANERKVCQSALTLAAHYPQRAELIEVALEIASEEMEHFHALTRLLLSRGETLGWDQPDPYMGRMFKLMRKRDTNEYLLDRLLVYAVVEARGCERFGLVAEALPPGDPLADFYLELTRSEARHHASYLRLAKTLFPNEDVGARLDEILDAEAEIAATTPFRPSLH